MLLNSYWTCGKVRRSLEHVRSLAHDTAFNLSDEPPRVIISLAKHRNEVSLNVRIHEQADILE